MEGELDERELMMNFMKLCNAIGSIFYDMEAQKTRGFWAATENIISEKFKNSFRISQFTQMPNFKNDAPNSRLHEPLIR